VLRVPGGQVQITPTPALPSPTQVPTQPRTHVVQRGENLFRIALRYGVSYPVLAQVNGIIDPNRIYVGQVLNLP
jgi:LysM repeat protein